MITYSETADALNVQLPEANVWEVTPVDDLRIVDYAADGSVWELSSSPHRKASICADYPRYRASKR